MGRANWINELLWHVNGKRWMKRYIKNKFRQDPDLTPERTAHLSHLRAAYRRMYPAFPPTKQADHYYDGVNEGNERLPTR